MDGLLHLVQRGGAWAGCGPAQSPHRCTKCNSPPINGQCTNHCMAIMMVSCSAVLMWRLKGWYTIAYSSRYCATARLIELLSSSRKARALRNGDIHLFVRWSVASRCAGSPTERPPPRVSQMFDRRENQPPPRSVKFMLVAGAHSWRHTCWTGKSRMYERRFQVAFWTPETASGL